MVTCRSLGGCSCGGDEDPAFRVTETRQKEVSGDVDVGTRMLVRCVGIGESVPRPEDVGQEPYSILIYIYNFVIYTYDSYLHSISDIPASFNNILLTFLVCLQTL